MYTKKFNPDHYEELAPLLEQIQDLEEGSSLLVSASPKESREMRWLLYDWLHHMGLKSLFRIQDEEGGFRVRRRGFSFEFSLEEGPLPPSLALLFRELLSLSREEAKERLGKERGIEEKEKEQLLKRWKRVMGEDDEKTETLD